jgi:iron-sulfur cluster repair protein YtfE (RIC family)
VPNTSRLRREFAQDRLNIGTDGVQLRVHSGRGPQISNFDLGGPATAERPGSTSSSNSIGYELDLGQFPFEFLIVHIIQKQHAVIREESIRLQHFASKVAKRDSAGHQDWSFLRHMLGSLVCDLADDIADEESRFALLLDLELAYLGEGPAPAQSEPIRDSVRSVSAHHHRELTRLNRICTMAELLAESGEPNSSTDRDFRHGLTVLYQEVRSHSDVENEVFTRAARMEAEMSHDLASAP